MSTALAAATIPADGVGNLGLETLRRRYRNGTLDPVTVLDAVLARIAARGDDGTWISRVPEDEVRARAAGLDPALRDLLPLWGVPFAVKDNIDVAGTVTTVACPAFAYEAGASASLVERLLAAGAVLVGKTNLDQFATGLNGTRSPYGVPRSVFGGDLISGGSSSGSAVAVAAGLVSFAIGTDTAGSGRVPAALNNVVGVKPSIGLVSAVGVVPACRSLDCPSVFSLTVADGAAVLAVLAGPDAADPRSRVLPPIPPAPRPLPLAGARFAVPATITDWGDRGEREAWDRTCAVLLAQGAELVPTDLDDLAAAGAQLYGGAWLAERFDVVRDLLSERPEAVLPVLRELFAPAASISGAETFAAIAEMEQQRVVTHALLDEVDALLTPTVTRTFTVAEMEADPIVANSRLGSFTTFTNLLDLCAVAVPAGLTSAGVPFGVTVQAPAGKDGVVACWAASIEQQVAGEPGAPRTQQPATLDLAVVGAHLEGMPLHGDLVERRAELVERTTTAAEYRLHALAGTVPPKPGLEWVGEGGSAIEVEVYRLPLEEVGAFLSTVHRPLGIGELRLVDGRVVHGFICEPAGLSGARDVTAYGGWRAYVAADVLTG